MRRLPPIALALVLAVSGCAGETPADAPSRAAASSAPSRAAAGDALLVRLLQPGDPGCAAAVGVDGTVAWAGGRGTADTATGRPITKDTVFDIASVSKQFTAVAVLLLAADGKLALTDPVAKHLPGLPSWSRTVTVERLLHHTSGIADYTGLLLAAGHQLTGRTTQQQALDAIAGAPAPTPGPFAYSNSNYVLLAEIVAAASGVPLPKFLQDNVFAPLRLDMAVTPGALGPDIAVPHAKSPDGTWTATGSGWTQIGDGSVHTTTGELVRWADNYRTGAVGGPGLLRAQLAGAVPTVQGGPSYGAGITVHPDGGLSHEGGWAGSITMFGVTADRRTAVAVSCNAADIDIAAVATGLQRIWTG